VLCTSNSEQLCGRLTEAGYRARVLCGMTAHFAGYRAILLLPGEGIIVS
jgi:hypothetical protein